MKKADFYSSIEKLKGLGLIEETDAVLYCMDAPV
jgi:hypothetical protein